MKEKVTAKFLSKGKSMLSNYLLSFCIISSMKVKEMAEMKTSKLQNESESFSSNESENKGGSESESQYYILLKAKKNVLSHSSLLGCIFPTVKVKATVVMKVKVRTNLRVKRTSC